MSLDCTSSQGRIIDEERFSLAVGQSSAQRGVYREPRPHIVLSKIASKAELGALWSSNRGKRS